METVLGINNDAVKKFLSKIKPLLPILKELKNSDGNIAVFCVGGATRDLFLGQEVKDIDLEVHNTSLANLEAILKKFTKTCTVGKRFLVIKTSKLNCDWAMARTDGIGRLPEVSLMTNGSYKVAAQRRDLTINSIGIDLMALADRFDQLQSLAEGSCEYQSWIDELPHADPFNGVGDIKAKRLKAVDKEFFGQDPLRLFRVAQFYSRLGFAPDQELTEICKQMPIELDETNDTYHCPSERIGEELFKLLAARKPSYGLKWLLELGRWKELMRGLEYFATAQAKNLFEQKLKLLDTLSNVSQIEPMVQGKKIINHDGLLFYALALLLDQTPTAEAFLKFIKVDAPTINKILKLYKLSREFTDCQLLGNFDIQTKLLAKAAWPELSCLEFFTFYCLSRPELSSNILAQNLLKPSTGSATTNQSSAQFCVQTLSMLADKIDELGVLTRPIPALINGHDAMELGFQGESIKQVLERAYNIQIKENISDKKELVERLK